VAIRVASQGNNLEQSDTQIKFTVPEINHGRYHVAMLTANGASMIEQPVVLTDGMTAPARIRAQSAMLVVFTTCSIREVTMPGICVCKVDASEPKSVSLLKEVENVFDQVRPRALSCSSSLAENLGKNWMIG
jgi:hypothetical protein